MAHELTPKQGRVPLEMDEIIRRLRGTFAHVEVDVERASRQLEESVRHMRRTGAPHFTQDDIERERQLIGRAVFVVLADNAAAGLAYLSFILEPDHEKIFIAYESGSHEDASRELRKRLARVLDYEMALV